MVKIQINTSASGTSTWYINGIQQPGSTSVSASDTYIAISGDIGGGTSAFTNLYIDYPAKDPTFMLNTLLTTNSLDGWSGNCNWGINGESAFCCQGNKQFTIRNIGASIFNRTIKFSFHTDKLGNFAFGCNQNGRGYALRLDARSGAKCGWLTLTDWNNWGGNPNGVTLNSVNWYCGPSGAQVQMWPVGCKSLPLYSRDQLG